LAGGGVAGPGAVGVDVLAVGGGVVEAEGVGDDGRGGLDGEPAPAWGKLVRCGDAMDVVRARGPGG
jgi:hypothetical protein